MWWPLLCWFLPRLMAAVLLSGVVLACAIAARGLREDTPGGPPGDTRP